MFAAANESYTAPGNLYGRESNDSEFVFLTEQYRLVP
jgi:hypothetical protein